MAPDKKWVILGQFLPFSHPYCPLKRYGLGQTDIILGSPKLKFSKNTQTPRGIMILPGVKS